ALSRAGAPCPLPWRTAGKPRCARGRTGPGARARCAESDPATPPPVPGPCLCKIYRIFFPVMSTVPSALPAPEPGAVLARAVLAAAARLGVRQRALAAVLGSSEASVSRLQHGRRIEPASKEGELALLFLRLYRSLDALVGGNDSQARAW